MSISVQNSNAALIALQTLGRLNDSSASAAQDAGAASVLAPQPDAAVVSSGVQSIGADTLGQVGASLDRASSITDAALSAGQTIGDLLNQMKALAGAANNGDADSGAGSDFAGLLKQLSAAVASGGFDGVNLLDGSQASTLQAGGGPGGAVTLTAQNLTLGGPNITLDASSGLSTQSAAAATLDQVDASIANLGQALDQIGSQAQQIQAHASFVSRLSDVLSAGAGDPTGGQSLSVDGARLMALSVQQQLSLQGGSIANSAPQILLSLFK